MTPLTEQAALYADEAATASHGDCAPVERIRRLMRSNA